MEKLISDEMVVFECICCCETSAYSIPYPPERVIVSTGEIAKIKSWTKYRVKKALHGLAEKGLIERASCGNPAVESYGEYCELVCESAPPKNGYAITENGFKSDEWNDVYSAWCRSMEEWGDAGADRAV